MPGVHATWDIDVNQLCKEMFSCCMSILYFNCYCVIKSLEVCQAVPRVVKWTSGGSNISANPG